MNTTLRQDIQHELKSQLEANRVLSTLDLEVTDANGQAHLFDVALHTGNFVYGRISIGKLSRVRLGGVTEKKCGRIEDIDKCVNWATKLIRSSHAEFVMA